MSPLAFRLYHLLRVTHRALGYEGNPPSAAQLHDMQLFELSPTGVLAIDARDYLLVAFPPDERRQATRAALRVIGEALQSRGQLKAAVFMFNWPSIRAVRKLGGRLEGVDKDHFFHYTLDPEGYRYGQAGSTGSA